MMQEYDENRDELVEYHEFLTFAEGEGYIDDRNWHAVNVGWHHPLPWLGLRSSL